jgi:SCP-2 sterol transfer family
VPAKKSTAGKPRKHEFLSPSWIDAVRVIRDEYHDRVQPPSIPVRANLVVTGAPFGESEILGSIDTASGQLALEDGHLPEPDLTITTDYATAKALFVQQDPNAAIQAVFGGKIRVQGDMTKMLALQLPLNEADSAAIAREIADRIKAFTAD